jgi:hypothetical protein
MAGAAAIDRRDASKVDVAASKTERARDKARRDVSISRHARRSSRHDDDFTRDRRG